MHPPVDENLKQWATTPAQIQAIDAVLENGGSVVAAARSLGFHHSTVGKTIQKIQQRATVAGYSPAHRMNQPVPFGFTVKGRSEYYTVNPDGTETMKAFWQKTKSDDVAREEAIKAAFEAMALELPRIDPIPAPQLALTSSNLCNLFTFTDFHMGMLAWHREGGADWDLKIAEETLYRAFEQLIASAPDADVAIINQLGDFLHTDGLVAETPTSGHALDADGRFPKIVETVVRVLRRIVARALETHKQVHIVMAEGNHDLVGSIWLRTMFKALFENEPRVTVDDSALPYYKFEWGNTLLGFHHGHLAKNASLPGLYAAQYRKEWGRAEHVYIHTGHRHHREEKEHPGATVVQHSTLAARDAYAARGGWFSNRSVRGITYHRDFGEVMTWNVNPAMLG